MNEKPTTRLDTVMGLLGVPALELSRLCGISNSLISRWQKGLRPLPVRSKSLHGLAAALARLDTGDVLDDLLAPYRAGGKSKALALRLYLVAEEMPALPDRAKPQPVQRSGSYFIEQQALLGVRGFRQGALLMLDYVLRLPPGQVIYLCAHRGFDLWFGNLAFVLQFIAKMSRAIQRGTTFMLVTHRSAYTGGNDFFSAYLAAAHLKGTMRSRYYEVEPPQEHFVGVIPGYWSGVTEEDDTAEDGLYSVMSTDARTVRRWEQHAEAHLQVSAPASQYGFLQNPAGNAANRQAWRPGPLPEAAGPVGVAEPLGLQAVCRVPGFGMMTQGEFTALHGEGALPPMPGYLFSEDGEFAPGAHRIILCREDVREGLAADGRKHEAISELLGREVVVPRAILAAQLERLLAAMKHNEVFEVALVPRSAFRKLEIEIVCWPGSVMVGWLQDGSESMLAADDITVRAFAAAMRYMWGKLQKGWKRPRTVSATLHKWLEGEELDEPEADSKIVENWSIMPKD